MKIKRALVFFVSFFLLALGSAEALGQAYKEKEPEAVSAQDADTAADVALGVLPGKKDKKVKSAIQKEAEQLKAQAESEEAIKEAQKWVADEEKERIERAVIEDGLANQ